MEELLKLQSERSQQMAKSEINYHKDSPERKTKKYLEKKIAELKALFQDYSTRDDQIQLDTLDENHPYRHERRLVRTKCEQFLEILRQHLNRSDVPTTPTTSTNSIFQFQTSSGQDDQYQVDKTEVLFKRQEVKMTLLNTNLEGAMQLIGKQKPREFIKQKLNQLAEQINQISQLHEDILMIAAGHERYVTEDHFGALFQNYEEVTAALHASSEEEVSKQSPPSHHSVQMQKIKLPPIAVPQFSGDTRTWRAFFNLFKTLIHQNNTLSKVQQLQYLRTSLTGEALKIISHLDLEEENYDAAWDLLQKRYENRRQLVAAQIQLLCSQQPIRDESGEKLKSLHDTTVECLHALKTMEIDTESWDPILLYHLVPKLDKESEKLYEQSITKPKEVQTIIHFLNFLESRFQALDSIKSNHSQTSEKPIMEKQSTSKVQFKHNSKSYITRNGPSCEHCNKHHTIYNCEEFFNLTPPERLKRVDHLNLCRNCLGHQKGIKCYSSFKCSLCSQYHHTLIHSALTSRASTTRAITQPTPPQTSNTHLTNTETQVLLATALIKVTSWNGQPLLLRALIDPGSQSTLITENAVQLLRLVKQPSHTKITGLGITQAGLAKYKADIEIQPHYPSAFKLRCQALILPKLTKPLPDQELNNQDVEDLQNLILADPTYNTPGPIDILVGADIYGYIILDGIRKWENNKRIAQKTELGWVLSGQTTTNQHTPQLTTLVSQTEVTSDVIDQQLAKFWELEEIPTAKAYSDEESKCEKHFLDNSIRNQDGTYTVKIPFNKNSDDDNFLGASRKMALSRLFQLEKKFRSNMSLKEEYHTFMNDYMKLGHMVPADETQHSSVYYLPHHAVIKQDSSTTKLRVVFDASAKTSNGFSLNDRMWTGPRLQDELITILLRWRKHKYVIKADIEKMFRQIKISDDHQNFQKIMWRSMPNEPIKEYKLTTVTYGTTSAPYLAIKTLQTLANDDKYKYPLASKITLNDFYVDDLMSGADTIEETKEIQNQVRALLRGAGFNLRKWASNHTDLLRNIPSELRENTTFEISEDETIKTLGISWNPYSDAFHFRVSITLTNKIPSKREVLSDASKIFDPLGWLAPATVVAKLLMQEIWNANLDWDEKLTTEINAKWKTFVSELHTLEAIKIPRWTSYTKHNCITELHGFCDASEKAYAAVIYSKSTAESGDTTITLIAAKTKVAPIKSKITLPRLELCGALLLSKLYKQVADAMNYEEVNFHAWTDSTIALAWITGEASRWKNFVANRVSEIQIITNNSNWHHIRSEDNPADIASRGIQPALLEQHPIWWTGPKWLLQDQQYWPSIKNKAPEILPEERKVKVQTLHVQQSSDSDIIENLINKLSSWSKITRVFAYCHRFINGLKGQKREDEQIFLTCGELKASSLNLIKHVQQHTFEDDLKKLQTQKCVPNSSSLISLAPFIDSNGLLRVGGRLAKATCPYDMKHPIILPKNHRISSLILSYIHQKHMHPGPTLLLHLTRQHFWILDGRRQAKRVYNNCIKCFREGVSTTKQLMGDLPTARTAPGRAFTRTGIDYAGPISLATKSGRGAKTVKGYIAFFVCMTTKAIHLEVVSDLTTDAFLASLRRFASRRGTPSDIYSDNGTNFIGAHRHLTELHKFVSLQLHNNIIGTQLALDGINWHLIPPSAPNFGGLWEAAVKSVKGHLTRTIGETRLTFEELSTLLCQIEAVVNSRPLCPISGNDPTNLDVLTPAHFLITEPLTAIPEPSLDHIPIGRLSRWQLLQHKVEVFWKRFASEYLNNLQQRRKWQKTTPNLEVGNLVLIREENTPPTRWPLARITEVHPGSDNLTRVVTVKTQHSTFKRPISKICLLPINENCNTIGQIAEKPSEQKATVKIPGHHSNN